MGVSKVLIYRYFLFSTVMAGSEYLWSYRESASYNRVSTSHGLLPSTAASRSCSVMVALKCGGLRSCSRELHRGK